MVNALDNMLCPPVCRNVDLAAKWRKRKPKKSITKMQRRRHNMESITQKTKVLHVGIDTHKDTNSVCCYDAETDEYKYEHKTKAENANVIKYLRSVEKQEGDVLFVCGYEAGPTGFSLYRALQKEGISCVVIAPTSLKKSASEKKRKNDRIDAKRLAKSLFTKDYKEVHVASEKEESIKEYCRMRRSTAEKLKTAKQELLAFLLRENKKYGGAAYWTKTHRKWLSEVAFGEKYLNEAFAEYLVSVNTLEERLKRIDKRLEEIAQDEAVSEKVSKLVCFSGIDTLTAVSIASEAGDFSRFACAWHFSNFVGLTVGEDSSGGKEKRLGITKAGNRYLRRLFIEGAKSIKRTNARGEKSKRLIERQKGQDARVVAYADRCRFRLRSKMTRMEMRGKNANVASTAAARELACFVWGMMTGNIA